MISSEQVPGRRPARWMRLLLLAGSLLALTACGSSESTSAPGGPGPQTVNQPTAVVTSARFTSAQGANWHGCMLGTDNQTWCWGSNEHGQLGAASTQRCMGGNIDCSTTPLAAAGGAAYAQIVTGDLVTCGLTSAGAASCWGMGGHLGDGQTTGGTSAVAVADNHVFVSLAASATSGVTCGIANDASVWCWGTGFGFGTKGPTASNTPLRWDAISGSVAWTRLVIGQGHACGLDTDGHAWCVGSALYGLLGDGAGAPSATPVAVAGGHVFTDIAASIEHTCALDSAGQAWCWGLGSGVGDGAATTTEQPTPVAVSTSQRFNHIAAGPNRSCALTADGSAWCWGDSNVGDGQDNPRTTPVAVAGNHRFRSLAISSEATCAVDMAGAAWCWGSNDTGALGIPLR